MGDAVHPIRKFYRIHLSKYVWANSIKQSLLHLWFGSGPLRNLIIWNAEHAINVIFDHLHFHSMAFERNLQCILRLFTHRVAIWCYVGATFFGRVFGEQALRLANWSLQKAKSNSLFFQMVSLRKYIETINPTIYKLASAETVMLNMPLVYPHVFRQKICSANWPLEVPEVWALEISDAEILGKCDFVFAGLQCLHHDMYQFGRDHAAEEMHGMISIDDQKHLLVRYSEANQSIESLPEAISLLGSASANYVHWLTETAPKLVLIDENANLSKLPVIIDDDLHPNILESLYYLNVHNRQLIPLKRGQICKVKRLITISPVAYAPFDYKPGLKFEELKIDPSWAMFVPSGLHGLRNRLLNCLPDSDHSSPVRLFLRRTSKFRQMQNAKEVEAMLQDLGFHLIEPESLSFAEQVKLFCRAEIIVAQAGAALGNMIFAPEGCHIVILSAWSPFSIYYYFSNIASILGQRCSFVLCNPGTSENAHPAHKGLDVDMHILREAIS